MGPPGPPGPTLPPFIIIEFRIVSGDFRGILNDSFGPFPKRCSPEGPPNPVRTKAGLRILWGCIEVKMKLTIILLSLHVLRNVPFGATSSASTACTSPTRMLGLHLAGLWGVGVVSRWSLLTGISHSCLLLWCKESRGILRLQLKGSGQFSRSYGDIE